MRLSKIGKVVKEARQCVLCNTRERTGQEANLIQQWIGTGEAMYPVDENVRLTEQGAAALAKALETLAGVIRDANGLPGKLDKERITDMRARRKLERQKAGLYRKDEDGGGVVLPCKVGERLWCINSYGEVEETVATGFLIGKGLVSIYYREKMSSEYYNAPLGKILFLTREAAERALEEEKHE